MKKIVSWLLMFAMIIGCFSIDVFCKGGEKLEPRVSVIVPVYNSEEWLSECMDSIVNQTLNELEIICVNDGSTDNSLEILQQYAARDSRITVINQENKGVSVARNIGIERAMNSQSTYITFVDSDDYLELNTFETAYNKAIEQNADIAIWGIDYFKMSNDQKITLKTVDYSRKQDREGRQRKLYVWDKLYRKELIRKGNFLFEEGLQYAEDVKFNVQVLSDNKEMLFISGIFYHHRKGLSNSLSIIGRPQGIKRRIIKLRKV